MEEDLRVSQNPSPLGRWTWNLASPTPSPPHSLCVSPRFNWIIERWYHSTLFMSCLGWICLREGKLWNIFASFLRAAGRRETIEKLHGIWLTLLNRAEILCKLWNLIKEMWNWWYLRSFRNCLWKDSCWQSARNLWICISHCGPPVTWLSCLHILFTF